MRTKSTKPNELKSRRLSLSMTQEEWQMILNRKIDTDISASLFLMRIIRKHLAEHKDELMTGVMGSQVTNQVESQPTPPTPLLHRPSKTDYVIGGSV